MFPILIRAMRYTDRFVAVTLLLVLPLMLHGQSGDPGGPSGPWPESVKPDGSDATSLKIFELHLATRGGREALEAIPALAFSGDLREGTGKIDYTVKVTYGAPAKILVETMHTWMGDDQKSLMASDGKSAWRQEVLPKRKNPDKLGGLNKQLLELDAMLPFLLLDPAGQGHVFAYRGEQSFAKRKVYVVHGWLSNGLEIEILFDKEKFLILNYRQPYKIGPRTVLVDRVPTGLMKYGKTWWENGYSYRVGGKSFRNVTYSAVNGDITTSKDTFKQPPTYERWITSDSLRNREG
jgi:hypothetical protein